VSGDGITAILALFLSDTRHLRPNSARALMAAFEIDGATSTQYVHIVLECIRGRNPALAEELMTDKAFAWPRNPWLEEYFRKAYAEGEASGEARGEAHGIAASILTILAARGLAVSESQRARIESADLDTLHAWIARVIAVPSVADLVD
jgi:hypothetical protein